MYVFGKLEAVNPGSSVKDRSAVGLLNDAVSKNSLTAGWTVVESSSGNMGHALAMLCAVRRYRFICVLDPKTPRSNVSLVNAFGGQVVMVDTPDEDGSYQKKRIAVAKQIASSIPMCVNLDQYNNSAAIEAHVTTTGPEIFDDLAGRIDVLVGSVSTGSHLSGIAKYMKSKSENIRIIGVEPVGSVVFGGEYTPYLQNGAGLSFAPGNIRAECIDEITRVYDEDAFSMCRRLATREGLLLGGSSGAVIFAAREYTRRIDRPCNIVAVLPDTGLKYLDTIYDDQWLLDHGMGGVVTASNARGFSSLVVSEALCSCEKKVKEHSALQSAMRSRDGNPSSNHV
jgi:2,3-diaminopropionate biosynthesis protein SbnA